MISGRCFDLIAFDWDGTLFDSTALIAHCIQAACIDLGVTPPSERDALYIIGMGIAEGVRHAVPELPQNRYAELNERFRRHFVARQDDVVMFEGVVPLLHALKERGHTLAVATGKSRRGLDESLSDPLVAGLFDGSRTADETASKPHPRMLFELMEEFGIPADRTLMIGDTTHDLQMARNAGVAAVGVSYGAHEPAEFAAFPTRHIAHTVADLHTWLVAHG